MKLQTLARAFVLAAASGSAVAAPEKYTIDPNHTYPSLETTHLGISVWRGKFNKTSGTVILDRTGKTGSVDVAIDAASIDFGHDKMNEHARGADFLKADQFPTITYKGKLGFKGDTPATVDGELTMAGVTKPVTLAIESFKCMPHPFYKKEVCGANATASFDRADFGMTYAGQFGTQVKVEIQVEALKD